MRGNEWNRQNRGRKNNFALKKNENHLVCRKYYLICITGIATLGRHKVKVGLMYRRARMGSRSAVVGCSHITTSSHHNRLIGLGQRVSSVAWFRLQTAVGWRPLDASRSRSVGSAGRHHCVSIRAVCSQDGGRSQRLVRLERLVSVVGWRVIAPIHSRLILLAWKMRSKSWITSLFSLSLLLLLNGLTYLVDWRRWLARHFVDGARSLDDGDNDQDDDAADNAVQTNGGQAWIPSAAGHFERIQWVSI